MFRKILDQLDMVYRGEFRRAEAVYHQSPVYVVSSDADPNYIYEETLALFRGLTNKGVVSPKRDFLLWLQAGEDHALVSHSGETLPGIGHWMNHMLLSEHKSRGVLVLSVPAGQQPELRDLEQLCRQVRQVQGRVLSILTAPEPAAGMLRRLLPCCQAVDAQSCSKLELLYSTIWERLDKEAQALLTANGDVLETEEASKLLKWELRTGGYPNAAAIIPRVAEALRERARRNGAIGFRT